MNRRWLLGAIASIPFVGKAMASPEKKPLKPRSMSYKNWPKAEAGKRPVFASAGETVTCENGHPICEFVETVHYGQMQNLPAQLGNWRQEPPKLGSFDIKCEKCGAKFAAGNGHFHFANGWRG